jgi:hypothetical protein
MSPAFGLVFRPGDHSPDHQDKIANGDTYQAGAIRCLLTFCRRGQRRPFVLRVMLAAVSNGETPLYHGRVDADPAELGISIQFDLVPRRASRTPTVEGRYITHERDVSFFAWGNRL